MKRALTLKKEALTELTSDELGAVIGGTSEPVISAVICDLPTVRQSCTC